MLNFEKYTFKGSDSKAGKDNLKVFVMGYKKDLFHLKWLQFLLLIGRIVRLRWRI